MAPRKSARKASSARKARSSSTSSRSTAPKYDNPVAGTNIGEPPARDTTVVHGLETGSRARTTLPEDQAPKKDDQTLTPIADGPNDS